MTKAAQRLHSLTKKRKTLQSLVRKNDADLEHSMAKNIAALREEERKKRIKIYGGIEEKKQQITSALMLELTKICEEADVPKYIPLIAKVLDNYQGMC